MVYSLLWLLCVKKIISFICLNLLYFIAGSEDDDHRSDNIRGVLVAVPLVFHHDFDISWHNNVSTHSGNLFGHLLAGNEQFHVQPHYLLLDERQVNQSHSFNSRKFYNVQPSRTQGHSYVKINHFHL